MYDCFSDKVAVRWLVDCRTATLYLFQFNSAIWSKYEISWYVLNKIHICLRLNAKIILRVYVRSTHAAIDLILNFD